MSDNALRPEGVNAKATTPRKSSRSTIIRSISPVAKIILLVFATVTVILSAILIPQAISSNDDVAASVHDGQYQILERDVTDYVEDQRLAMGLTDDESWQDYLAKNKTTAEEVREDAIEAIALHKEIMDYAYDHGMPAIMEEDLVEARQRIAAENGLDPEDATFEEQMVKLGYAGQALDNLIEEDIAKQFLGGFLRNSGYGSWRTFADAISEATSDGDGVDQAVIEERDAEILEAADSMAEAVDGYKKVVVYTAHSGEAAEKVREALEKHEATTLIGALASANGVSVEIDGFLEAEDHDSALDEAMRATEVASASEVIESEEFPGLYYVLWVDEVFEAPEEGYASIDDVPDAIYALATDGLSKVSNEDAFNALRDELSYLLDMEINPMPTGLPYDI